MSNLKHFNDCKAFIEYSNGMDNIYKNIKGYNQDKKRKILIFFLITWLLACLVIKNLIQ